MLCCSIRSIFYSNKTQKLTPAHKNIKYLKRATNAGAAVAATAVHLIDGTRKLWRCRLRRTLKDLLHFLFRNQAPGHLKRKRWLSTKAQHVPGNLKHLTTNPMFERRHNQSKVSRDTPISRHNYYYNATVIIRVTVASLW